MRVSEQPFIPSSLHLCHPHTWQHLSGVWLGPRTKHKDLLLYCYSTVNGLSTPPSRSSDPHAEGMARPFHLGLEGHQESRRLWWIFILGSNFYYFFGFRWLSPLYSWSQVEVLASHLALKQVHCKHTFSWLWFTFFFVLYLSYLLYICTV